VSAIAAEFIGGWILRLTFGADANQPLPTFSAEALVFRVGTATTVAVHNTPLGQRTVLATNGYSWNIGIAHPAVRVLQIGGRFSLNKFLKLCLPSRNSIRLS
jgi:hypothetical protein